LVKAEFPHNKEEISDEQTGEEHEHHEAPTGWEE
jgi:hypothetical protein